MNKEQPQAQVPEEKLEEVSSGFFFDFDYGPKDYWHYVCDKCGHEEDYPCTPLQDDPDPSKKNYVQYLHNKVGGKTGSCKDGTMVYQGKIWKK